ncbi:YtxH domain-containing protein [Blattabacterium cuenoti]|uniref:YtxH domain-containing protein n=1 Tax=Blattabacterium cuenoti TaxID=1653831 RepID=UPI00163BF3F6|nr:YtxH domain-containing protein [Blattabacterium cuenoti]
MKRGGNFFWGIILGSMAGLIIGMMLTQKKEQKIRNILGKKTEELRNNFQEFRKKIGEEVYKIKSNIGKKWKNKIEKIDQDKVENELGT